MSLRSLSRPTFQHRRGSPPDAQGIAALATLVFLDTYASTGIRADLAREVFSQYSASAFAQRLEDERTTFLLVEAAGYLVAFVEVMGNSPYPAAGSRARTEVVRLYVHPRFHRQGLGSKLLRAAERLAGAQGVWLAVWAENALALAFYARLGYKVVGTREHVIEGKGYQNHVLVSPPSDKI